MPTPSNRPPAYRRQREKGRTDRAYVRIDGKKIKLGVFGSPESRAKYAELLAKPEAASTAAEPTGPSTVSELILSYLSHAQKYYRRRGGTVSNEYDHFVIVLGILRRHYGTLAAKTSGRRS